MDTTIGELNKYYIDLCKSTSIPPVGIMELSCMCRALGDQAKEHILAEDIFQIVLSQRFERRTFADPFEVYRALRTVNPSPYMTYLQARGSILVASSPEILTRVKKSTLCDTSLEEHGVRASKRVSVAPGWHKDFVMG
ncbi:anthranilate synthase alpha subunit 2, chloroplastic-like protein [Tanacetum coccineum]